MKKTLCLKYQQTFKTAEFILKERKTRHQMRIFSIKQISSPSKWWYQLVWHGMGKRNHFLLMDVDWKRMQIRTSDIYRKNFYLLFNTFINIKIGFVYKTMYHHTVQTLYKIFYKKHSIHILSKHKNGPPCHLTAIPLISFFWNKVKEKVYESRLNKPVENKRDVKKWIKSVWKDIVASNFHVHIQRILKPFMASATILSNPANKCCCDGLVVCKIFHNVDSLSGW